VRSRATPTAAAKAADYGAMARSRDQEQRCSEGSVGALIGEKDAAIDLLETNIARGFGKQDWVGTAREVDRL
jgi:hypothetical protein